MRPGWGSRHDRVSARDAALRRISWWTAALAAGSVLGTAAVTGAAQVAAHPSSVDVPTTITVAEVGDDTSGDPAGDQGEETGDGPAVVPAPTRSTAAHSTARSGSSKQTGTRSNHRSGASQTRQRTRSTANVQQAPAPRRQAPKPPPVTSAGS